MRSSRYLILSDSVLVNGDGARQRVVLHSSSGQIYLLDEDVLQVILRDSGSLPEVVVRELAAAGIMVDDDRDEFAELVGENLRATARVDERTFVLMPSAYCNMGCGYCGQRHVKTPQGREHRQAVVDRVLRAVHDPRVGSLAVNWFGGEPMMGYAQILDISAAVIPECDARGLRFSSAMVTNGALLTVEKIRRLHLDCRVGSFEITLDGPADVHDAQRPLRSGRRSFDRIVGTIRRACEEPDLPDLRFHVRTNVSRDNQDTHEEFAAAMREAGLAHPKVGFYATFVRPWGNDVSAYAVPADQVVEVELRWLLAYRANGLAAQLLPIERAKKVCVAVTRGAEVIDPTGNVHSCTEQPLVPGRERTALGHVTDLGTPLPRPKGAYDSWNEDLLGDTTAFCPSCSLFPICGGSCPLLWHEGTPACPSLRVTLPMRLTLYGRSLGLRDTA